MSSPVVIGPAERKHWLGEAIHCVQMEGLTVTDAMLKDGEDYVNGLISSEGLVSRVRARYGLE